MNYARIITNISVIIMYVNGVGVDPLMAALSSRVANINTKNIMLISILTNQGSISIEDIINALQTLDGRYFGDVSSKISVDGAEMLFLFKEFTDETMQAIKSGYSVLFNRIDDGFQCRITGACNVQSIANAIQDILQQDAEGVIYA